MPSKELHRVSIFRSLYLSVRHRGVIVIMRGTRIGLGRKARIRVPRGSRLVIGRHHTLGGPCSLTMWGDATLTINGSGRVTINSGTKIFISPGAHLQIGCGTGINFDVKINCFKDVRIGERGVISWNANILDDNIHALITAGVPEHRSRSTQIGDHVWIGTGVTVCGATIGGGSVVGAGSVVVSDVPSEVLVAGNPARVIRRLTNWML